MKRFAAVGMLVFTGALSMPMAAQQKAAAPALEIRTLSTRPEFVTGGDVLVQVSGPATLSAKNVAVRLNGKDVSAAFKPAADTKGLVGLLTGLQAGSNAVSASMRGNKAVAQLTITNHPIAGPVLYSPHQTPFACETQAVGLGAATDADCSAPTKVEYFYRTNTAPAGTPEQGGDLAAADNANGFAGAGGGAGRGGRGAAVNPFKPFDPNGPRPTDIAMTTTSDGRTVPYIVRREMGTINRAIYSIAVLYDPAAKDPTPWNTGGAWNGRLVYTFGGGVAWGYHQGRTIGGLNGGRFNIEDGQYGDYPVAKGFAVAGSSLNVFGTYANDVVSAETLMMVKEHFIEEFGVPKWTIGSGRSGGSMQQYMISNNYPGLLDAIDPTASFADTLTFQTEMQDCELIDHAMTVSKQPFTLDQKTAVSGYSHFDYCTNNKLRYSAFMADLNCDLNTVPLNIRYAAEKNPKGVRCTYQDAFAAVYGIDPKTGFARRPFDNVGVQYGLKAFNDGKINFAQFLDINRLAGGHDANGNLVPQRDVADPDALRIAHESGRFNDAAHGLAALPVIDMRPYVEGPGGNVHDTHDGTITRARLIAANGNADNQISRVYAPGAPLFKSQDDNLDVLDQWLAAIAKDNAPGTQREKVIRDKPAGLTDACYTAKLEAITDPAKCKAMFPVYSNAREVAGVPLTNDRIKCQLKPIDKADYKRPVTDAQLAQLKTVFAQGVCDYSKPGVSEVPARTWQTYPAAATQTATTK